MMKIKSFFTGIILLAAVFAMVFLAALIYRASERSSVKSYIFQMGNFASERIGELQNVNDMTENDLRNKLIKFYVSEYFKVIPGDKNVTNRPVLDMLSSDAVFRQWQQGEAQTISDMSEKNMFRMVRVMDDGIATYNKPKDSSDNSELGESVYYMVRYYSSTWPESNLLGVQPVYEQGTIYLEVLFEPGLKDHFIKGRSAGKKINVREYLESGQNPVGLFKFYVNNIGDSAQK